MSDGARDTQDDGHEDENQQPTLAGLHGDAPHEFSYENWIAVGHERVQAAVARF
jgi:hypothetical protein